MNPRTTALRLAEEAGPAGHRAFSARTVPRRRSVNRAAGTVCALVAACGAAGGGGYILWTTEFERPALVRRLPSMPVPAMDLTPVQPANAATNGAEASTTGTASRIGAQSPLSTPEAAETSPARVRADVSPDSVSSAPSSAFTGQDRTGDRRPRLAGFAPALEPTEQVDAAVLADAIVHPLPVSERAGERPAPASEPAVDRPGPVSAPAVAADGPDSATGIVITKRIRADHVAASLERARDALLAGDDTSAAHLYRTVLEHEPGNRDARLGLAAVAVRADRWVEAAAHYARILASGPADTFALAALIAIGERDPATAEDRLKALLRSDPRAAHLHFVLGSLYATRSRWPEAQQSWLNAYRFDPANADYAYNLAVSLDHLSQPRSALGLYREALLLSRNRPASFDAAAVRRRIHALGSPPEAGSAITGRTPEAAAPAPPERTR